MKPLFTLMRILIVLLTVTLFDTPAFSQAGSNDPTFNEGISSGANDRIRSSSIQSDGKIIIGGQFTSYNGTTRNSIARLNTDGTLDAGFNHGTGANFQIDAIAIQSNGKILIGGQFNTYNGITRWRIARVNTDGSLDASFNPSTGSNGSVYSIAIQSDGKIIIGGGFTTYNKTNRSKIARLNTDGSLDASFNPGTGANNTIETIAIQSDGKIIIGGDFTSYNGTNRNRIVRLNTNGTLDVSFNVGTGVNSAIRSTAIQSDGKIIITGMFTSYSYIGRNRIARLNTDGSLDASFDPGSGANNAILTSAIQSDGKIIIGGQFTAYNGTTRNRIARLNTDGSLDEGFASTGANGSIWTTAIQSNGNIIVGGEFTTYNGTGNIRIARLLTASPLPLHLLNFTVKNEGNSNLLRWHTANELSTKNFIVEKSSNGNSFATIAIVPAQGIGAGNYTYTDNAKQSGAVYYRLKMVDIDNQFTYSPIVKLSNHISILAVFPNPAKDFITVTAGNHLLNKNAILTNMQGVPLQNIKINSQVFTINISTYPTGMYLLKLDGEEVMKIVKD
ncbi:MAG: T9SS type A sorting domain-containing protein [Ginsengibacter sp.]